MPKLPPHIVWPGFVIGLLLMSVAMVTVTVVYAVGDPSFAVESDYYERGLRWDDHMAQQRANEQLGWRAAAEVGAPDAAGRRPLTVKLTDRAGEPILGAALEASVFHYTAAHQIETQTLAPTEAPGVYSAPFAIGRDGKWQLSLTARSGETLFTNEQTMELVWQ